MKNRIFITLSIVVSFVVGFFCCFVVNKAQTGVKQFLRSSMTYSMKTVRDKCSGMGVELPLHAWNVDFHWQTFGPDAYCYLAFSADEKDIAETIHKLKKNATKGHENFSIPAPVDNKGRALSWWPSKLLKTMDVQKGMFYWTGYDKHNSRVYIYRFTE
ncbi:MAG: hypothetical protein WC071_12505 [Victivallaceae bacterium]